MKLSMTDDELDAVENMSDEDLVGYLRDGFKAHRAARDANGGNVASSKEIEVPPPPLGADDPPPTPGTPRPPQRNGASAMDSIIPGYSRMGNRNYTPEVDADGIVKSPSRGW